MKFNNISPKKTFTVVFILQVMIISLLAPINSFGQKTQNAQMVTSSGVSRLSKLSPTNSKQFTIENAKINALLNLRKKLYQTTATKDVPLGIFILTNTSIIPLLENIINNASFSKPKTIVPDLIEITAYVPKVKMQQLIGPILLGKNPSSIEFSNNNLILNTHENKSPSDMSKKKQSIFVFTKEGSNCNKSFLPTISCHDNKTALELQQKLATFVVEKGVIEFTSRTNWKKSHKSNPIINADSIGGVNNTIIFLTDKNAQNLISKIEIIQSPKDWKIIIVID